VQGSQRLHTIEREGQLDLYRLFHPKRAVVIEGRDALGGRDKIRPASFGDPVDKNR
jgi:hypothetical protein